MSSATTPRYKDASYGGVYSAVVSKLSRSGVTIGRTAHVPRIEVHTITEGERLDKVGDVRQLSLTVECIGNASLADTASVNDKNVELLSQGLDLETGWRCIGIIPDQLQDLTETSDTNKILYRLLQGFTIWVERVKTQENTEEAEESVQEEPAQETNE